MAHDRILQAAIDGDPTAGPILISIYGRRLTHYVRLIARNLTTTEQELLAEEAVETAIANIAKYDPAKATFDAWLRGFARRKLLAQARQPQAINIDTDALDFHLNLNPPTEEPPTEQLQKLQAALQQLDPSDQLIIGLRDINGLSHTQIAETLGCTAAASRQRHHRAIGRLRDHYIGLEAPQEESPS